MTDSILLFTFSPVQSFINEARRTEDLFNGSAILVELAKAAALALGIEHLVYPADLEQGDVPNSLTAKIPTAEVKDRAKAAQEALMKRWQEIAADARKKAGLPEDTTWQAIWKRQIEETPPWQFFWAAVEMKNANDYAKAYREARETLDAIKHSRTFVQIDEPGQKDSLSGQREALHKVNQSAKKYWAAASSQTTRSRLRPDGKERLDSIGLVKRFTKLRKGNIPSVSTVAAWDFYQRAKENAHLQLLAYRQAVELFSKAHGSAIYRLRSSDETWPFDGDLFFEETLTPWRMKDSYDVAVNQSDLGAMLKALKNLNNALGERPSPYYAVTVLDGDSIGEYLDKLLDESDPEEAHRNFSRALASFSKHVRDRVTEAKGGFLVYNGGDDVVCLASREKAIALARELAKAFNDLTGSTASAGIVIAHHLTPLSLVLEEARVAERAAKSLKGKNAICVTLLKRSGSPLTVRSKWVDLDIYEKALTALKYDQISNRLPYALVRDAPTLEALDVEGRIAGIKFLLGRHGEKSQRKLATLLQAWAAKLEATLPEEQQGLLEVANWLMLARFMASGGE